VIPLDYATPQPPRRARYNGPVLRFGGGLALGFAAEITISKLYLHNWSDETLCSLIGIPLLIFICCGILRAAAWVREKLLVSALAERAHAITFVGGFFMIGVVFGCGELCDHFSPKQDGLVTDACLVVLPAMNAWVVFRRQSNAV